MGGIYSSPQNPQCPKPRETGNDNCVHPLDNYTRMQDPSQITSTSHGLPRVTSSAEHIFNPNLVLGHRNIDVPAATRSLTPEEMFAAVQLCNHLSQPQFNAVAAAYQQQRSGGVSINQLATFSQALTSLAKSSSSPPPNSSSNFVLGLSGSSTGSTGNGSSAIHLNRTQPSNPHSGQKRPSSGSVMPQHPSGHTGPSKIPLVSPQPSQRRNQSSYGHIHSHTSGGTATGVSHHQIGVNPGFTQPPPAPPSYTDQMSGNRGPTKSQQQHHSGLNVTTPPAIPGSSVPSSSISGLAMTTSTGAGLTYQGRRPQLAPPLGTSHSNKRPRLSGASASHPPHPLLHQNPSTCGHGGVSATTMSTALEALMNSAVANKAIASLASGYPSVSEAAAALSPLFCAAISRNLASGSNPVVVSAAQTTAPFSSHISALPSMYQQHQHRPPLSTTTSSNNSGLHPQQQQQQQHHQHHPLHHHSQPHLATACCTASVSGFPAGLLSPTGGSSLAPNPSPGVGSGPARPGGCYSALAPSPASVATPSPSPQQQQQQQHGLTTQQVAAAGQQAQLGGHLSAAAAATPASLLPGKAGGLTSPAAAAAAAQQQPPPLVSRLPSGHLHHPSVMHPLQSQGFHHSPLSVSQTGGAPHHLLGHANIPQGSGVLRQQTKEPAYHPQVEAISPAPEESRLADAQDAKINQEREELKRRLDMVDANIAKHEAHCRNLCERKERLLSQLSPGPNHSADAAADGGLSNQRQSERSVLGDKNLRRSYENTIQSFIAENRQRAQEHHLIFTRLCGNHVKASPFALPLYRQPADLPPLRALRDDFRHHFRGKLIQYLRRRRRAEQGRIKFLSQQYARCSKAFTKKVDKLLNSNKRRQRDLRYRDIFEKVFPEVKKSREDRELSSTDGANAVANGDPNCLQNNNLVDGSQPTPYDPFEEMNRLKDYAIDPPLSLAPWQRRYQFISRAGLISDCRAELIAEQNLSKWSAEEKQIFRERYLATPKNFTSIANYLERKTVAECIHYYYLSKKKEGYKQQLKKNTARRRRPVQSVERGGGGGGGGSSSGAGGSSSASTSGGQNPSTSSSSSGNCTTSMACAGCGSSTGQSSNGSGGGVTNDANPSQAASDATPHADQPAADTNCFAQARAAIGGAVAKATLSTESGDGGAPKVESDLPSRSGAKMLGPSSSSTGVRTRPSRARQTLAGNNAEAVSTWTKSKAGAKQEDSSGGASTSPSCPPAAESHAAPGTERPSAVQNENLLNPFRDGRRCASALGGEEAGDVGGRKFRRPLTGTLKPMASGEATGEACPPPPSSGTARSICEMAPAITANISVMSNPAGKEPLPATGGAVDSMGAAGAQSASIKDLIHFAIEKNLAQPWSNDPISPCQSLPSQTVSARQQSPASSQPLSLPSQPGGVVPSRESVTSCSSPLRRTCLPPSTATAPAYGSGSSAFADAGYSRQDKPAPPPPPVGDSKRATGPSLLTSEANLSSSSYPFALPSGSDIYATAARMVATFNSAGTGPDEQTIYYAATVAAAAVAAASKVGESAERRLPPAPLPAGIRYPAPSTAVSTGTSCAGSRDSRLLTGSRAPAPPFSEGGPVARLDPSKAILLGDFLTAQQLRRTDNNSLPATVDPSAVGRSAGNDRTCIYDRAIDPATLPVPVNTAVWSQPTSSRLATTGDYGLVRKPRSSEDSLDASVYAETAAWLAIQAAEASASVGACAKSSPRVYSPLSPSSPKMDMPYTGSNSYSLPVPCPDVTGLGSHATELPVDNRRRHSDDSGMHHAMGRIRSDPVRTLTDSEASQLMDALVRQRQQQQQLLQSASPPPHSREQVVCRPKSTEYSNSLLSSHAKRTSMTSCDAYVNQMRSVFDSIVSSCAAEAVDARHRRHFMPADNAVINLSSSPSHDTSRTKPTGPPLGPVKEDRSQTTPANFIDTLIQTHLAKQDSSGPTDLSHMERVTCRASVQPPPLPLPRQPPTGSGFGNAGAGRQVSSPKTGPVSRAVSGEGNGAANRPASGDPLTTASSNCYTLEEQINKAIADEIHAQRRSHTSSLPGSGGPQTCQSNTFSMTTATTTRGALQPLHTPSGTSVSSVPLKKRDYTCSALAQQIPVNEISSAHICREPLKSSGDVDPAVNSVSNRRLPANNRPNGLRTHYDLAGTKIDCIPSAWSTNPRAPSTRSLSEAVTEDKPALRLPSVVTTMAGGGSQGDQCADIANSDQDEPHNRSPSVCSGDLESPGKLQIDLAAPDYSPTSGGAVDHAIGSGPAAELNPAKEHNLRIPGIPDTSTCAANPLVMPSTLVSIGKVDEFPPPVHRPSSPTSVGGDGIPLTVNKAIL